MLPQRTLVIGDIHGNLQALLKVLDNARFDITKDRLICIGDYVDGWGESFEVVRTLLEIKNNSKFENVFLLGNHDKWFLDILTNDFENIRNDDVLKSKYLPWYTQGGKATLDSYLKYDDAFIEIHKNLFFDKLKYFHIENNKLFVHAGFDPVLGFEYTLKSNREDLIWNRTLYQEAYNSFLTNQNLVKLNQAPKNFRFGTFEKIYIGHSPTTINGFDKPMVFGNLINMDQGCKKNNILSIWVDETNEFYQNN